MNDKPNSWTNLWAASQQALMTTMFPASTASLDGTASGKSPLEEQFAELRDTWKESMEKWTTLASERDSDGQWRSTSLQSLFSPNNWSGTGAFDAGLRHVIDGPKYAVLFDLDRQLLLLRQLAVQRDKDVARFQGIMTNAWNEAFKRFSTSLASTKDQAPSTWRDLADRWISTANDTFIDLHRSELFIDTQRKMLRSASDYRLQERKIAEAWCDAFHIPTRTEMDEMQRTVSALKRQLRAVQRSVAPPAPGAEVASPPTKRRIPSSKPIPSPRI
jgi:hypothetical protein